MKDNKYPIAAGSLLLMVSSQATAHTADSSAGLLHLMTGEHVIMISLMGVLAAGLSRFYRRFR